jgi:outer membrane protein TolC
MGELFDNWISRLAGNIVAPILDAGRRRAELKRARGAADERLAAYKLVVLRALREVEDSLALERHQQEHVGALERQLEAARQSLSQADLRYRNGAESYLSVLTALTKVQELERRLADAARARAAYRVGLYRALAGGWPVAPDERPGHTPTGRELKSRVPPRPHQAIPEETTP